MQKNSKNNKKAWVVAVDMGYGHQRTAHPLRVLSFDNQVIIANNYDGIPQKDKRIWRYSRNFYEFISNFTKIPLLGAAFFSLYDRFQRIMSFYPKRDLSKPDFSLKFIYYFIAKGWGRDLIKKLNRVSKTSKPPLITTFYTIAFMAEFFGYQGDIYCVVCDADIARPWAALNPKKSRIRYFAPNSWVANRLKMYGVKEENIFLTGYPLPPENIGAPKMEILKEDLKSRLLNLDPKKKYFSQYQPIINKYLGNLPKKSDHLLTIMFSIGGAGAQKEIAMEILKSLSGHIKNKLLKVILSTGMRKSVKNYFLAGLKELGLEKNLGENIELVYERDAEKYFKVFNEKLRKTDILWTKPSELSFYVALGAPIIMAPSIGSQEDFNRRWLTMLGAGIEQEDPKSSDQWLFDYLDSGRFAEAAMQGFIEAEKLGFYKIRNVVFGD